MWEEYQEELDFYGDEAEPFEWPGELPEYYEVRISLPQVHIGIDEMSAIKEIIERSSPVSYTGEEGSFSEQQEEGWTEVESFEIEVLFDVSKKSERKIQDLVFSIAEALGELPVELVTSI